MTRSSANGPESCRIVVVGGANTDYLIRTPHLPRPGAPMSNGDFVESCGGKGLNQAVAAARLGASVAFVSCVGADARGDAMRACLSAEGVRADYVASDRSAATGATIVQVDTRGRKQTSAALGANHHLTPAHVDAAGDLIAAARVLLVQFEVPLPCVERAVQIARAHRVLIVVDPAPAHPAPDALIDGVDVVKPNAEEARALTGIDVTDRASAAAAARRLRERGARAAIVSAAEGSLLLVDGAEHWYPNLPVHTIDSTGAGDAFAGALAVALLEERPLTAAVAFAHAAAALATTRLGAMPSLPRRAEIERLLNQVAYDSLPA